MKKIKPDELRGVKTVDLSQNNTFGFYIHVELNVCKID